MCRTISCTRFSRNCLWNREFDCWGYMRAYRCLLFTNVTSNNNKKKNFSTTWLTFGWMSTSSIADDIDQLLPWIYYTHLLWLAFEVITNLLFEWPQYFQSHVWWTSQKNHACQTSDPATIFQFFSKILSPLWRLQFWTVAKTGHDPF